MKLDNRIIPILVAAIGIYAIFLFISDYNVITEKISNFKINYLPLILLLVSASWVPLIIKWHFLLKNSEINIPLTKSIAVFFSGAAFEITPGQIGALIKSQLLKTSSNISRTKTVPIVIIEKSRFGNSDKVEAMNLIGNVEGSSALIVDDEIDTGNSVIAAAKVLKQFGATDIYCTAVHPVFSGNAYETLDDSVIKEIVVTDTLPLNTDRVMSKIKIVSISQILGEAIHRIHNGLSVGAMFDNE